MKLACDDDPKSKRRERDSRNFITEARRESAPLSLRQLQN